MCSVIRQAGALEAYVQLVLLPAFSATAPSEGQL